MTPDPCCRSCTTGAPFFLCHAPLAVGWLGTPEGCPCHIAAATLDSKRPHKLGYTDKTAEQAIGNLTRRKQ